MLVNYSFKHRIKDIPDLSPDLEYRGNYYVIANVESCKFIIFDGRLYLFNNNFPCNKTIVTEGGFNHINARSEGIQPENHICSGAGVFA